MLGVNIGEVPSFIDPTYGLRINADAPLNPIQVEMFCYRNNVTPEQGGLGKAGHFRRIAEMLYGPKSNCPFVWNPWAEKMNEAIHQHPVTGQICPHVAFSGCANSGKSHFAGLYGLINWMVDAPNTFVFVTSTSISDSKHRVWKSINKLFSAVPGLPGTLVDSKAKIVTNRNGKRHDDTAGIFIAAGAQGRDRDGVGKLIGKKNPRVFLIADELPELSPAVLEARANLLANPFFQFIAMGNFKSREDPFGEVIEPKDGWDSISIDSEEWECAKHGAYCVRFDGLKSPNIRNGKDIYPGIYGSKQLKDHRASYDEHSAGFMRMCRSFETPIGYDNTIYSESELASGRAREEPIWMGDVIKLAAYDPSWTNGGDRFILWLGKLGRDISGKMVLFYDTYKPLFEDVRKAKERTRSYQMADQLIAACIAYGVEPRNCGGDTTAGGGTLADVIEEVWGGKIYRVDFSGSATDRMVSHNNPKTSFEQYCNRVSELWYVGVEFLKHGQLKGIKNEQAREMKARKYETIKGPEGLRMKVETKADMKERLSFSPDIADSGFVLLDLARQRGLMAGDGSEINLVRGPQSFRELAKKFNRVYTGVRYAA